MTLTSKARSRRSRRVANNAGRVQPLLLVKKRRNELVSWLGKTPVLNTDGRVVHSLDQLRVLFECVGIALFCDVRNDEDILYRYLVPRAFYRAFVSRQRLPLRLHVTFGMVMQRQL